MVAPTDAAVFTFPVTVRYMEVDVQGVVFNGWYFTYFDEAMAAFFRHRGLPYPEMMAAGYDVQLVRSEIDYKSGVRFGEPIVVAVSPSRLGRTSFTLDFQIRRESGEATTNGRIIYVVVSTEDYAKREIPPLILDALGEPHPLH
ncbi:MAG TPA: thioesterase family protein [Pseudonocardia sp.]|uniref:acyl-CoA thioesterase n=1 Tax=Pseudonocardia sp. TaxID=60912 RepID=UPI002CD06B9D|nr:thioesterase family protein [Pseudonocardia sp.]HTF48386.1 thioesterase family protein [Pseudonocardia sp.]